MEWKRVGGDIGLIAISTFANRGVVLAFDRALEALQNTLVVDDEPLAREGLKLLLGRQAGVESVSEARNGREAIAIIRERPPDLVLLDVQIIPSAFCAFIGRTS